MSKIALVIGTRPEAIKMAPVYLELRDRSGFDVVVIATAQHRQMLDQVLSVFAIVPEYDLNVMKSNQSLTKLTSNILLKMKSCLENVEPDAVLVHGDTTTCFASALAAFYQNIPVGHVEAGLRTYDFDAPWPEEMNRRLVDPISRWCFAPTEQAAENLRSEAIPDKNIYVTGNTIVDALHKARRRVRGSVGDIPGLSERDIVGQKLVLVTGHRRESFGEPFRQFCYALKEIASSHSDVVIIYPVHLNPNVQKPVMEILGNIERVHLIDPVDYLTFLSLLNSCYLIITDSGGIQEEAPSFGKPVLVTREETERPEAMQAGLAKLVGMSRQSIVDEISKLLRDPRAYSAMTSNINPYGDGKASERIVAKLAADLGV